MATKKTDGGTPREARLETLKVGTLVPHPDQATYFPPDPRKLAEIVLSVKAKGVETPLDVLPPGNAAGLGSVEAGELV